MRPIPHELRSRLLAWFQCRGIPAHQNPAFLKWLTYFLDFCGKHRLPHGNLESLSGFLAKLREKKQGPLQLQQATLAVTAYYDFLRDSPAENFNPAPVPAAPPAPEFKPIKVFSSPASGASWKREYSRLTEEIRIRHSSPKTLSTYRLWLRQFQACTRCWPISKRPTTWS